MEMMVALGILAAMVAATSVTLSSLGPKFNLGNGARTTAMVLIQAQTLAITRGHMIDVVFGTSGCSVLDVDQDDELLATYELPAGITLAADTDATFSPLGTVTPPVAVTLSNGTTARTVSVGFTGQVQIQ